jgi:ABC-2 type transport system permease protein
MLSHIATIARNTFVESIRQPIYFVIVALCAIAILFTTWSAAYSMAYSDTAEVSGDNKVLLDLGLATVFVCGMLLAAFLATAVISKEIERKTVLTVVSKPVSRVSIVLGKYLGVAGAITIAGITMLLFMQMALRHQVMTTAADEVDMPVVLFSGLAIAVALGAGIWCNFFYGWVFTQTSTMLLLPLMVLAWIGVMFISKEWRPQPPWVDFKPQIAIASICILLALLVLSAVATAASARLGQVMTLVVLIGVFVGGLMSNHFLGRRTIAPNPPFSQIQEIRPEFPSMEGLRVPGDRYIAKLAFEPRSRIEPGLVVYFGPNPSSSGLLAKGYPPGRVNLGTPEPGRPASLVVAATDRLDLTLQRVGGEPGDTSWAERLPEAQDYLFTQPPTVRPLMLGLWGAVTNVQTFWLIDAVSQNQPVPLRHLGLVMLYALAQIGAFLSLAVVLFQTREVG